MNEFEYELTVKVYLTAHSEDEASEKLGEITKAINGLGVAEVTDEKLIG